MQWRHIRRTISALGLLFVLIVAFWPQVARHVRADANSLTLNPTSGPPGTVINVTATGTYTPGDNITLQYFADPNCGEFPIYIYSTVQQDGTLPSMNVTVPATTTCTSATVTLYFDSEVLPLGPVTFHIAGNGNAATSSPTGVATVTGTPPTSTPTFTGGTTALVLSSSTAALGQPVNYSAGGFTPGEQVTLGALIGGAGLTLTPTSGTLVADSGGRVSGTLTLPANAQTIINNGSNGNAGYTAQIRLTGTASGVMLSASLTVPPTSINAGTNAVTPGGTFTVTGGGFASNETVTLSLINSSGIGTTLTPTLTSRADGTIIGNFTAPSTNGVYTLKAVGQSGLVAQQPLSIGQPVGITLSPVIVTPGQNVTVTGFGFTHNSTITLNGLDGGPITVTADKTGAFTITLASPPSAPNSVVTVRALDTNSLSASAYLTLDNGQIASLTAAPMTVNPGQAISAQGANFAAGESVALTLASSDSPTTPITSTRQLATVDATRAFSATYIMPVLPNGTYLLVATGQASNRTAVTSIALQNGLPGASPTQTPSSGFVPFPTQAVSPTSIVPTATATPGATGSGTQTTYFAEGYTGQAHTNSRATFRESLDLFNSAAQPSTATVTYYVANAAGSTTKIVKTVSLGALTAASLSVNADAGNDKFVSIAVTHAPGITAQMTITRTAPNGATIDAAATTGSAQAANAWNFAEGYIGEEFQEYLSFFNPNPAQATVHVHFLPTSGTPPAPLTYTIPANGRQSINVRSVYLGLAGKHAPKSIAITVTSDQQIVADRVLYWGSGAGSGKFGYEIAPGIPAGSTNLAFPALILSGANEPYITVLNPGSIRANIQLIFRDATGRTLATYSNSVAGLARLTVPVRFILRNASGAVSAVLTATAPIVAEAPLYFGGSPNVGSHPGIAELGYTGATTAVTASYSAANSTLYVFNPGSAAIVVTRQLGSSAGAAGQISFSVPPLGIYTATLPAGSGPHGLRLSASGPFTAAVINGGGAAPAAWGGTLLAQG